MTARGAERLVVPRKVMLATQLHLKAKGAIKHEGVVLWRGTTDPLAVSEAIVPVQDTSAAHFSVPLPERRRIARLLAGSGESVVAQVHSHPHRAYHSSTDDQYALPRRVGSLSLVIPDYCRRHDLLDGAVLFQLRTGDWWDEVSLELLDVTGVGAQSGRDAR